MRARVEYLDPLIQITGFLSFIGTLFAFFLICLIVLKARRYQDKLLYVFALYLIGLNTAWYSSAFSYIFWVFTKHTFIDEVYIVLGTLGVPIYLMSWSYVYTTLIARKYRKKVLIWMGILSLLYYISVIIFMFAPQWLRELLIGFLNNPFDSEYRGFVLVFIIFAMIFGDITIPHFCLISIRDSKSAVRRWNGIFFLIATILYNIGVIIDGFVDLEIIPLIIIRLIIFISAILFYLGLIMPNWFKKILRIEEET
ncbi:MAG: hypothetical protein ACFFBP_18890 [Promethearchaeota archaeon]